MSRIKLQSELTLFDVTNLAVGAIIGADIYVASSLGAGYLGPLSLLVWVVAGIIAIVIALCFAQCAALLPKVGGPYAYIRRYGDPLLWYLPVYHRSNYSRTSPTFGWDTNLCQIFSKEGNNRA